MGTQFPIPRSDFTGLKTYPCGGFIFGTGHKTALKPGVMNIEWEETVNHIGSPFRIALSYNDDEKFEKFILVDHIPHNDQGGGTFEQPKNYTLNVTIPDIKWYANFWDSSCQLTRIYCPQLTVRIVLSNW